MKNIFLVLLFTVNASVLYPQEYAPLHLVEKIMLDTSFIPEISKYVSGDYEGMPNSSSINSDITIVVNEVKVSSNYAVIETIIRDTAGVEQNYYFHLEKEEYWKVSAFRGLALPGMYYMFLDELEKIIESDSLNEIISTNQLPFNSERELRLEYQKMLLAIKSDQDIINHFNENNEEFMIFLDTVKNLSIKMKHDDYYLIDRESKIKYDYKVLLIDSVKRFGSTGFMFMINGMIDNEVGYLYLGKEKLPEMNSNRWIIIKEITDNWFLYKTT